MRTVADLKALFIDTYNARHGLVHPPPRRPPCLAGSLLPPASTAPCLPALLAHSLCPPSLVRPRCRACVIPAADARPLAPARATHAQPQNCVLLELGRGKLRARLVQKEATQLRRGTHNKPARSEASPRMRARTRALTRSCRAFPAPALAFDFSHPPFLFFCLPLASFLALAPPLPEHRSPMQIKHRSLHYQAQAGRALTQTTPGSTRRTRLQICDPRGSRSRSTACACACISRRNHTFRLGNQVRQRRRRTDSPRRSFER